jgi:uncharacterized membrane protein
MGGDDDMEAKARAGWPYWTVAVLSLLWNAMGAVDFTMTASRSPGYLAQVPPEVIDWLDSMPVWAMLPWVVGTFGAVAGSLALLLRSWLAVPAFALSLAGLAALQAWQISSGMPDSMKGASNVAFAIALWIVAVALWWFAILKRRQGVLR